MNDLMIFTKEEMGDIRVTKIDGKNYFVGIDVAKILDYARPNEAISAHCRATVSYRIIDSLGREQESKVIPEGDIYRLIVKAADQSKNPKIKEKAEKFERWIFEEILPSLMNTGGYVCQNRAIDFVEQWLPQLDDASKGIIAGQLEENIKLREDNKQKTTIIQSQTLQIEEMTPKASFADRLMKSKDNILVREYAKVLQDEGFNLGERKLYGWFKKNKYLMENKEPYQMYMKYFALTETTFDTLWGTKISKTTKIRPEGQLYFYEKLMKEFNK
jgi:prophage antirepressor-like protein